MSRSIADTPAKAPSPPCFDAISGFHHRHSIVRNPVDLRERENANLDDLFRSANRGDIIDAVFDPLKGNTRTSKKALPSLSEANSAGIALKQGSAKLIFKIADAPAHHRFLNTQYCCRLAKASLFRCKNKVIDVAQLYHKGAPFCWDF
jgi:hypothetical protein